MQEDARAEPEDALEPVVAAGVEALESERDPRRAVIKAYLAMERTLGEQGMPRQPSRDPARVPPARAGGARRGGGLRRAA